MLSERALHLSISRALLAVGTVATAVCMVASSEASDYATKATRFYPSLDNDTTFQRFIVAYRDPEQASARIANDLAHVSVMTGLNLRPIRRMLTGAWVIEAPRAIDRDSAQRILEEFGLIDGVAYAQPDHIYQAATTDPDLGLQWHLSAVVPNTTYPKALGWSVQAGADVIPGWNYSTGAGVVIAVIDTGMTDHPDLTPNTAPPSSFDPFWGFDFVYGTQDQNDPAIGDPLDPDCNAHDPGNYFGGSPSSWHGTHVMGLAAAAYNNGLYGAGVAPNAILEPIRALGAGGGYESEIADAIVFASGGYSYPPPVPGDPTPPSTWTCNGNQVQGNPTYTENPPARVINLSLGRLGSCSSSMQQAIDTATGNGSIIVAAAGNYNTDVSNASPAGCNKVIAVAATDFGGHRGTIDGTPYSDYGAFPQKWPDPGVTIAAPGGGTYFDHELQQYFNVPVMSDWNTGTTTPLLPNFMGDTGTSMAAPLVSGLVAAMVSIKPWLSASQVQTQLGTHAHPWGTGGVPVANPPMGMGLMDAAATLSAVSSLTDPPAPTLVATPNPVVVPKGQTVGAYSLTWNVPGYTVVDVYTKDPLTSGNDFWRDGIWPASITAPNHSVGIDDPITWRLCPHGQPNVVLAEITVTAQH